MGDLVVSKEIPFWAHRVALADREYRAALRDVEAAKARMLAAINEVNAANQDGKAYLEALAIEQHNRAVAELAASSSSTAALFDLGDEKCMARARMLVATEQHARAVAELEAASKATAAMFGLDDTSPHE